MIIEDSDCMELTSNGYVEVTDEDEAHNMLRERVNAEMAPSLRAWTLGALFGIASIYGVVVWHTLAVLTLTAALSLLIYIVGLGGLIYKHRGERYFVKREYDRRGKLIKVATAAVSVEQKRL